MTIWHYMLEGRRIVRTADLNTWAEWYETADRIVAKTQVDADVEVSTVFLGLDHRWPTPWKPGVSEPPPVLFETLVFGGPYDGEMRRYCTWEEAEAGHAAVVAQVSPDNRVVAINGGK